jgi:hypothetical protein
VHRLRPIDRVLLAVLVPTWVFFFGLSAASQFRHPGYTSVFVASPAEADDYPMLTGFRPWLPGRDSGLRIGDRLLRVGDADLQGVGPYGFYVRVAEQDARERQLPVVFERAGERGETSLPVGSYAIFWPFLVPALAFAVTAWLLLFRARPSPMAHAFAHSFGCIALVFATYVAGSRLETYAATGINLAAWSLVLPLVVRASMRFPLDQTPMGRPARWGPWIFAIVAPLVASSRFGTPFTSDMGESGAFGLMALAFATVVVVMTRNYPRAQPIGRRQLRWVLLGFYLAAIPPMAGSVLAAFDPRLTPIANFTLAATAMFPISIVVAVARYNLFDIDRLISGAASYSILLLLLALAGEVLFESLSARAAASVGFNPDAGQVIFVLLVAVALVPAQRAWRPYVDRISFAEGRSLEASVEELLEELSLATDVETVMRRTGAGIERAFNPEFIVIYERAGEVFEPTCVTASREFPPIAADNQGIRALETKVAPIRLDPRGAVPASAGQMVPLVSGAAVIVPLRPGGAPSTFIGIGPKRSGDVYTSTDLSLLSAVAHAVSVKLVRGIPHQAA